MCFLYIFLLLTFLLLIPYINSEETDESEEKPYCSLYNDCNNCILCEDYQNCNFYNILCYQNKTGDYKKNDELKNNLSISYKKDTDIINFCHSRNITLDSNKETFTIFESPSNKLMRSYHCEYYITNKYYYSRSDSDKAKLNFEIKSRGMRVVTEDTKINFFLIFLYKSGGKWRFFYFDDNKMRKTPFIRDLNQITEFEILLDFFSEENNTDINENLILSIITENPSINLKKIYIAIIIVLCFFLLLLIITLILFFICRKRLLLAQEKKIREERAKLERKKKLIEKFKCYELRPKIYRDKKNFNNFDSCSICYENFISGKSEVSITPCFHAFHYKCIIKWVNEKKENSNCPNCNFKFIEYMENPNKNSNSKIKRMNYDENKTNAFNIKNTMILEEEEFKKNFSEDLPSSEYLRIKVLPRKNDTKEISIENNDKSGQLTLGKYLGNNNNDLIEQ